MTGQMRKSQPWVVSSLTVAIVVSLMMSPAAQGQVFKQNVATTFRGDQDHQVSVLPS